MRHVKNCTTSWLSLACLYASRVERQHGRGDKIFIRGGAIKRHNRHMVGPGLLQRYRNAATVVFSSGLCLTVQLGIRDRFVRKPRLPA